MERCCHQLEMPAGRSGSSIPTAIQRSESKRLLARAEYRAANIVALVESNKQHCSSLENRFRWVRKLVGNSGSTSLNSCAQQARLFMGRQRYSIVCNSLPGLKRTALP